MSTVIDVVIRCFDIEAATPRSLAEVMSALTAGNAEMRPPEIKQVATSLLEVRLEGSVRAVSDVVDAVTGVDGVRIHNDRVRRPEQLRPGLFEERTPRRISGTSTEVRPTVVAVVDSGIMAAHPDLKDHLWSGAIKGKPRTIGVRCIDGKVDPDVTDLDGHGTRLAGTILLAAAGAPGVRLMTVKFFDDDALPGPDNGADAIDLAITAQPKADIINLSWDLGMGSPKLQSAIERACAAKALVVIAAGNTGADNDVVPGVPAYYRALCPSQIITVMATDQYHEKASFSDYGKTTVDIAAPGVDIATTRASLSRASQKELAGYPFYRRYRSYSGTSAAAALISGMAARIKSEDPTIDAIELKKRLCARAEQRPGLRSKCIDGKFLDPLA
jgi:subtilisin family serine protease